MTQFITDGHNAAALRDEKIVYLRRQLARYIGGQVSFTQIGLGFRGSRLVGEIMEAVVLVGTSSCSLLVSDLRRRSASTFGDRWVRLDEREITLDLSGVRALEEQCGRLSFALLTGPLGLGEVRVVFWPPTDPPRWDS